jgi:Ca-activated chloride channel family protein
MHKGLMAIALLVLGTGEISQQSVSPQFRVEVDAVRVDALVTHDGKPMGDLTVDQFELFDNGVRQRIETLTAEQVPVSVIVVLDVSQSMAGERLASVREAARALVVMLRPIDRASILEFSDQITQTVPFTAQRSDLLGGLRRLASGGGTSLYDAVYAGISLGAADGSRNLLLVLSDGADTASWLPAEAVEDAAKRSESVIYAVAAGSTAIRPVDLLMRKPNRRWGSGELRRASLPDKFLSLITQATGGRLLHVGDDDLAKAFSAILKEFQARYLLTYFPTKPNTPGWHEITLRLKLRGADVQAKRGYWR